MELPGIGLLSILSIFLSLALLSHMTKTNRTEVRAHLEEKLTINKKQSGSPTVPRRMQIFYCMEEKDTQDCRSSDRGESRLHEHCCELN